MTLAKQTSGGRIGRTVYLPPDVWSYLDRLARREERHLAVTWEVRHGSASSVIEAFVTWDAEQQIQQLLDQVQQLQAKVELLRRLKSEAAHTSSMLGVQVTQLQELLQALSQLEV